MKKELFAKESPIMRLSIVEYQSLVEQAPIMIWRAGIDKLCNYFNDRWLAFTGRTMIQEVGNGWAEGIHSEDLDRCVQFYMENFDARRIFEMEYRLRRHDGEYRWIFDRGVPYFDNKEKFLGYIGSCIDITEKTEAQRKLEEVRNRQIEQLHKLLPLCAWCKKIRDDAGYWKALDEYFQSQNLGTVTHGICEECLKREIGEFYKPDRG
jgi:PAS domain S-box-containing protein